LIDDLILIMGKLRPIEEIAAEAKTVAAGLGIAATGKYEKRKNIWFFEITNGTEYKWRSLGALKKVKDHFNRSTFEEQILEVTKLVESMGFSYTGQHNNLSGGKRKFEITDGVNTRWASLNNLRAGKNPFRVATVEEQFIEAKKYANALGLNMTGQTKLANGSRKYEVTNGIEPRWITKEHLKSGKSPYTLLNLEEQQKLVCELSTSMGFKATGKTNGLSSNRRKFEVTDGQRFRWTSLNRLQKKIDPFLKPTLDEQKAEAIVLAKDIELTFTGNTQRNSGHNYFEVTDGAGSRWITLGGLRKRNNPFKEMGFDATKRGVFYILKIKVDDQIYIGYGISNEAKGRLDTHKYELAKINGVILEKIVYQFSIGKDANNLETQIKRIVPNINLGIKGFRTECTTDDYLEKMIFLAEQAYESQTITD